MKNENKIKNLKIGAQEYKAEIARLETEIARLETEPETDRRNARIASNYQEIEDNLDCLKTIYRDLRAEARK